jgi:class 3 adenylate cyclase
VRAAANANLYPDATVLFADIAGFTKWSSSRSPIEVFELLETIYGAFDKIANRRGVFKIETIGDCYVATTGLPNPQPDHAVIMAKFANDCMNKLRELIHGDLIERLGEDTGLLAMRFGFHSGPVTAGVLRGERSRFQIFGDSGEKQDASLYHGDCTRSGILTFLFILLI